MLVRGVQRFPLRNSSPEKPGRPSSAKDPTIVNSNKRWQNELRGTISSREGESRSHSPKSPVSRREVGVRLNEELDHLRRQNATLQAREMCSRDELNSLLQHCKGLEDAREAQRAQHQEDTRQLRADKDRAEAELEQVISQRDLLWKSHSTLQSAVERLEEQVQLHQEVIQQLRQRNTELESEELGSPGELGSSGMASPEMSAVMQQLMQLLHSEPDRVITELCAFPVGTAVRLLQKDVLPLLPIDAAVCDRIQLQLLDVHTPADLGAFKQQLLASLRSHSRSPERPD